MKKYDAFISYTHSSEMDLAMALDDGLTRFAKPWNKLRAKRIYRDTDSQALTPNLLGAVQQAMDNSEFLILMASPASARSNWVPEEIAHWAKRRSLEKLLIVVCDGKVVWDDEAGDFDWEKTDCLPRTLQGVYEGQPLYLDLRWARGETDLSLQNDRFKDAVARLSGTLSGKSVEDMLSEEVIQFRRTTRIRNAAIATLSVLFVAATVAAVLAVLTVKYRVDQIIAGVVINIFVLGLTSFYTSQILVENQQLNDSPIMAAFEIPLLGDIPFAGNLFKSTQRVDNKAELLIFVTPRILEEGSTIY